MNQKPAGQNEDNGATSERAVVAMQSAVAFSGPIPPPSILRQYNDIVPGAAERIIVMSEKQSLHRQQLEKNIIHYDGTKSILGLLFALTVALVGLLAGAHSAIKGQPLFGATVSITVLGGIVYAFIYGTRERAKEVARKKEDD